MHSFASRSHRIASDLPRSQSVFVHRETGMASKALLVFALLLAVAFLVSSANEHTEAKKEEESKAGGYPYGGYPGRGGGGYPGRGGGYPGRSGGYPGRGGGGGYPGRGGHCRYGCCGRGHFSGCRCCSSLDEIPEPMYRPEVVEVHN